MEEKQYMKNSINRLPDELLIAIVSRLPLIEAVRTSVLAHKWRYFWIFNSVLKFDDKQVLCQLQSRGTRLKDERIRFVKWVNRILNLHSCATIDEFRILFDLDKDSANDIDKWIEFAFRKRVEKLELNLLQSFTGIRNVHYTFPSICDPIERVRILPLGLSSCESLVTLSLTDVDVNEEVLVFFISNCRFLEELCVRGSGCLKNLRTSCQAPRLRRLEIVHCRGFKSIDICSPNLLSYTYYGNRISMALKNVQCLSSLTFGAKGPDILFLNLVQVSGCLSRLETLTLHTGAFVYHDILPKSPYLPWLKKLVIWTRTDGCESLLGYTSIMNAAPQLREIVLKITWSVALVERTIRQDKGLKHHSLEVLQIEGFCGAKPDLEVALYVVEHAVSLKKIVIDFELPSAGPRGGRFMGGIVMGITPQTRKIQSWYDGTEINRMATAREGVRLLKSELSRRDVELIVL